MDVPVASRLVFDSSFKGTLTLASPLGFAILLHSFDSIFSYRTLALRFCVLFALSNIGN